MIRLQPTLIQSLLTITEAQRKKGKNLIRSPVHLSLLDVRAFLSSSVRPSLNLFCLFVLKEEIKQEGQIIRGETSKRRHPSTICFFSPLRPCPSAFSPEWWWRFPPTTGTSRNRCRSSSTSPPGREGGASSRASPSFLESGATAATWSSRSGGRRTTSSTMHLASAPPPPRCPPAVLPRLVSIPATPCCTLLLGFPRRSRSSVTPPGPEATPSQTPPQSSTLPERPP